MTDCSLLIKEVFKENNLQDLLNKDKTYKLSLLISNMLEVNKVMNLTSITDEEEIILKHIADSATVIKYIPKNAKLLDVGTGAGFPALPIAVLRDDVSVYAVDSTAKKLKYIDNSAVLLGLSNIKTVAGRAEELGKSVNYREKFDVVTARAVASLNVLTELCVPFVKLGGCFLSMKGSSAAEEILLAKSGIAQLGGSKFEDVEFSLTYKDNTHNRHIVLSKKIKNTPECFPRPYARISKKPL